MAVKAKTRLWGVDDSVEMIEALGRSHAVGYPCPDTHQVPCAKRCEIEVPGAQMVYREVGRVFEGSPTPQHCIGRVCERQGTLHPRPPHVGLMCCKHSKQEPFAMRVENSLIVSLYRNCSLSANMV
ncbi:hypothetical protein DUNSADRAFT_2077 [Dunaliella salina]|uniref:Encoded protein n=1 Tax=Dunaliella salina TaxID=3046 RepID=A0ABQ7FWN1_DUNSA|nr:hypothetical protein DUNSADRAFT_2077 [Dunaliella salina]|eukprot:KAF5826770.1 hypothetical protein DUNSADRAFT_2077 [Dunaliella salina]